MKKLLIWGGVIFIVLIIIGLFAGGVNKNTQTTSSNRAPLSKAKEEAIEAASEAAKAEEVQAEVEAVAKVTTIVSRAEQETLVAVEEVKDATAQNSSKFTASQLNAIHSAQAYLAYAFFSRKGLIHKLSSKDGDEYSVVDATIAVDNLDIDWNQQAIGVAKDYLEYQGFSCERLIDQMSSSNGSKFTVEQATYGAQQAGACS